MGGLVFHRAFPCCFQCRLERSDDTEGLVLVYFPSTLSQRALLDSRIAEDFERVICTCVDKGTADLIARLLNEHSQGASTETEALDPIMDAQRLTTSISA
jgi:hypothetical protein